MTNKDKEEKKPERKRFPLWLAVLVGLIVMFVLWIAQPKKPAPTPVADTKIPDHWEMLINTQEPKPTSCLLSIDSYFLNVKYVFECGGGLKKGIMIGKPFGNGYDGQWSDETGKYGTFYVEPVYRPGEKTARMFKGWSKNHGSTEKYSTIIYKVEFIKTVPKEPGGKK